MNDVEISIILPVFNGADILRQSLEKLRVWISARTYSVELIVVNDCSSDSSLEILERELTIPFKGSAISLIIIKL